MNCAGELNKAKRPPSRRDWLVRSGSGLAGLALASLLAEDGFASGRVVDPLAPKKPDHPPKVKSVIWLFMQGGPSHIDLFEPKPELLRQAGKQIPGSYTSSLGSTAVSRLGSHVMLPSKRTFKQYGQSGLWVSDWYPHIATHADELCMLHACRQDGVAHVTALCQMNTGAILPGRPALGCWVTYGLGSANQNLPTFIVLSGKSSSIIGGAQNWSSGFLPVNYQGIPFRSEGPPILDLTPPDAIGSDEQRSELDLLKDLNEHFATDKREDSNLESRINAYELAYRMQQHAPEAVDLSKESEETKKLYGLDDKSTNEFGSNCLMARRLVERGVRFVEVYGGAWDAHKDIEGNHSKWCKATDQPISGLLTDLKARGLLNSTLVVWGGEFGRTPYCQTDDDPSIPSGRDHNPWGFTMWMTGAGIKPGIAIGRTDDFGMAGVEGQAHVHDIHATILDLMGLNHNSLTYLHSGRSERPTINGGQVVKAVYA